MCDKYINATVCLYKSVDLSAENDPLAFNRPFDGVITVQAENGTERIGSFVVVTQLCLIGTITEEHHAENILHSKGHLDVLIRLTKCDKEESNRLAIDIDRFDIDIANSPELLQQACFPFLNYTRITKVQPLDLIAGSGSYVIKVLIKRHEEPENQFMIQAMRQLSVIK